jgi:hypothetical protein
VTGAAAVGASAIAVGAAARSPSLAPSTVSPSESASGTPPPGQPPPESAGALSPASQLAGSAPRTPLAAAYRRARRDLVAEIGERAGAQQVAAALRGRDRETQLAAIEAAPAAEDAWVLLEPLARAAASPERRLAAAAARAAAGIAVALDRDRAIELDVPLDALRWRREMWRRVAADARRSAEVRVHALEVTTALAAAETDAPATATATLLAAAADADAEVRRAALELVPLPLDAATAAAVGRIAAADPDPAVALAAAQAVCAGAARGGKAARAALSTVGVARVRELVAAPGAEPAAVADAARCLVGDTAPASRAALRRVRGRLPRELARELDRSPRARAAP